MLHIIDNDSLQKCLSEHSNVIVFFCAPWCGPCRMLSSIIEDVINSTIDDVIVAKVDVEESDLGNIYNVQTLPTIIAISNGVEVASHAGFMSKSAFKAFIEDNF